MSLFGGKREDVPAGGTQPPGAGGKAPRAEARATATKPGQGGRSEMANIGKSITIKGDLTGNEDMVIEGKVDGKVELPNNQLTVGANGTVRAEVNAKSVVVIGRVTGNVNGSERVEIQGSGTIEGDVQAPRLVVAEGAVLNGSIQMTKREAGAAPARPPGASEEVRKVG